MISMENKFCFLKGIVDCSSGVIQNCNNMRTEKCPLEEAEKEKMAVKEKKPEKPIKQGFCFFKGELVDCSEGRVQDCNNQRSLRACPLEEEAKKQDPWELVEKLKKQKDRPDKKLLLSFFKELMNQEIIARAMYEAVEPEIRKREEAKRDDDIRRAVEAMRDLGHQDNEIKKQLISKFALNNKETKRYI